MPKPRLAKVHSAKMADQYLRLGWTLQCEFYAEGDNEPYGYILEWQSSDEPISPVRNSKPGH
jgi:hypothetical protein